MIFDLRFQIDNRKSAIENEISPLEAELFAGMTIAAFTEYARLNYGPRVTSYELRATA